MEAPDSSVVCWKGLVLPGVTAASVLHKAEATSLATPSVPGLLPVLKHLFTEPDTEKSTALVSKSASA